jgi:hypothetical protein
MGHRQELRRGLAVSDSSLAESDTVEFIKIECASERILFDASA